MRHSLPCLAALFLTACATASAQGPSPDVVVLYSLAIDQNDVLDLSIYNPTDGAACTSYVNWPGTNDNLRVVGRDGKEWKYAGLIMDPVGHPQDVRIAPHSEVTVSVDVRKAYRPVTSEARIGKVYYGARFRSC